jgi:hypothetical protein
LNLSIDLGASARLVSVHLRLLKWILSATSAVKEESFCGWPWSTGEDCWNGKSVKALKHKLGHLLATLDPPSTLLSLHCRHYPLPSLAALYQYSSIIICGIPTFSSRANLLAMVLSSSNGNSLELFSQSSLIGFAYLNH